MRVEGRDAGMVAVIALISAVLAVAAGASPTGTTAIDVVMVFVGAFMCVWSAASAPWWAGVVASGVALAFAPSVWLIILGLIPFMGGMAIGTTKRSLPWSRALVAAVAIQVFARIGDVVFFGFSSLLAIVVLGALAVFGIRRRPRVERRRVYVGVAVVTGVWVLALVGFALAGSSARPDLENGSDAAQEALASLRGGDLAGAKASFARAAEQFAKADDDLSSLLAQPSRIVPVAAQYRRVASSLVDGAATATAVISEQLGKIDYDQLKVTNGAIDVTAIESLAAPLAELDAALDELAGTVTEAGNPWLVDKAKDELNNLSADLAKAKVDLTNARSAVEAAPEMLGSKGRRVYFIAFTTPSEARGLGGFMGNWAEVTLDQGKLTITRFGRTSDLREGGTAEKTLQTPTTAFVAQYGNAIFKDRTKRIVGNDAWFNITISPDFPAVAQMIAELYPQSGGQRLDGVFAADVYTIAELMTITGPVDLPEGGTLAAENAVKYLLLDQYQLEDQAGRVDTLEAVASTTITRLLTSTLPAPPELAEKFGPLARAGRLVAWSAVESEQAVLRSVNMAGILPDRNGADSVGFAFNNGAASKIDSFMQGDAVYDLDVDRNTGSVTGTVTLTMRNTAPPTGLPLYVIGNSLGLPNGTNRTDVQIYTALPVVSVSMNDQPFSYRSTVEEDHQVTSVLVDTPAGETVVITVEVAGSVAPGTDYDLVLRSPASANPIPISVSVNNAEPVVELDGPGVERVTFPGV